MIEESPEQKYKRAIRAAAVRRNQLLEEEAKTVGAEVTTTFAMVAARENGLSHAEDVIDAINSIGDLIKDGASDDIVDDALSAVWKLHESKH